MTNSPETTYDDNGESKAQVYTIDNIMVYYADEYKGTLVDHSYTEQHSHDFTNPTMAVTYVCAYCDGKRVTTDVAIDADGDNICDVCEGKLPESSNGCTHEYVMSHTHDVESLANKVYYSCKLCDLKVDPNVTVAMTVYSSKNNSGRIPSVSEIVGGLADEVKFATDFPVAGNLQGIVRGGNSQYVEKVQTDDDKNYFLRYVKSSKTGYAQINLFDSTDTTTVTKNNFESYKGKTYTLTFNFRVETTYAETIDIALVQFISRLGENFGSNLTVTPLHMTSELKLLYNDGKDGKKETGVTFTKGEWYTISVQHTPKTNEFDVYVNGECVKKDAVALSDDAKAKLNWTASGYTVTPEDFMPALVRFANFAPKANAFCLDDIKMYYDDDYLECKHKYTDSAVCDWCGKTETFTHCDLCDGEVISENAAIVGRSATLGELIDMNVYVKLANENKPTATLTCENKSASFDLSTLTPEVNGTYKLSLPLNSIYMAKDVTLEIGDGAYTTSIKEYAEELLRISTNDSEKALVKALLNYGAAAQEYFAVKNADETLDDVLANAGLSDGDKDVKQYTAYELIEYRFTATGTTDKVRFNGASFVLSAKTYMKIYFSASESATVEVDGESYSKIQEGDEYYVLLTIPAPAKASDGFGIKIKDGAVEATTKIAVHTALEAALYDTTTDAGLIKVLNAYVNYCDFAGKYVK